MNIKKLIETQETLWQSMQDTGYCREYILGYKRERRWIEANAEKHDVSSYDELCKIRLQSTKPYKVSHTTSMFGTFERFEENGEFPDRRRHQTLVKKASCPMLRMTTYFCGTALHMQNLARMLSGKFAKKYTLLQGYVVLPVSEGVLISLDITSQRTLREKDLRNQLSVTHSDIANLKLYHTIFRQIWFTCGSWL